MQGNTRPTTVQVDFTNFSVLIFPYFCKASWGEKNPVNYMQDPNWLEQIQDNIEQANFTLTNSPSPDP